MMFSGFVFNSSSLRGAFQGSLDAEWLEINSVFSEVMKAVEDARLKALQPLEQRSVRCVAQGQVVRRSIHPWCSRETRSSLSTVTSTSSPGCSQARQKPQGLLTCGCAQNVSGLPKEFYTGTWGGRGVEPDQTTVCSLVLFTLVHFWCFF